MLQMRISKEAPSFSMSGKDRTCSTCHKLGHLSIVCRSGPWTEAKPKTTSEQPPSQKKKNNGKQRYRKVKSTTTAPSLSSGSDSGGNGDDSEGDAHFLHVFTARSAGKSEPPPPRIKIRLNGTPVTGIADSGAQIYIIPKRLAPPSLLTSLCKTTVRIKPYGATSRPIQPNGSCTADVTWSNTTLASTWYLIEDTPSRPMVPLISYNTCISLGIITFNEPTPHVDMAVQAGLVPNHRQ